jgi:hypothetical protein
VAARLRGERRRETTIRRRGRTVCLLICFTSKDDELGVQTAREGTVDIQAAVIKGIDHEVGEDTQGVRSTFSREAARYDCDGHRSEARPHTSPPRNPLMVIFTDLSDPIAYTSLYLSFDPEERLRLISL